MKWKVQITGDQYDLDELTSSLTGPGIIVRKESDGYYLEYNEFAGCQNASDVQEKAAKLLPILRGATRLALGGNTVITLVSVVKEHDDGTCERIIDINESINVRGLSVKAVNSTGNLIKEIHPADEVPQWVSIGLKDKAVEKVLRLFGLRHDWVNLYRIYEVIEHDTPGGIDAIDKNGWAIKSSLKLFKRTANNPAAVGDNARHGEQTTISPAKPMLLSEARAHIETLINNWLRSKQLTQRAPSATARI